MARSWGNVGEDIVGEDIVGALTAQTLPYSMAGSALATLPLSSTGQAYKINLQRAMRPDRIVINRVHAASVAVTQVQIGTIALNCSDGVIDGDCFAPDAVGTDIKAVTTATPSLPVIITIMNKTAGALPNLSVAIFGPSVAA